MSNKQVTEISQRDLPYELFMRVPLSDVAQALWYINALASAWVNVKSLRGETPKTGGARLIAPSSQRSTAAYQPSDGPEPLQGRQTSVKVCSVQAVGRSEQRRFAGCWPS
jgi:hypothetical protein